MYRKGNRTRRSYCSPALEQDLDFKTGPKPDDDLAVWWADKVSETKDRGFGKGEGVLTDIRIGQQDWSYSQGAFTKNRFPSDTPVFYSMVPEFQCRPPLGGSGINFKIDVNKDPKEGPKGTILLELVRTGHRNEVPVPNAKNAPVQPTTLRYWIDPAKGYLVVRWDMGPDDSTTAEECVQSPSGIWYPTRVLRTSKMPDGRISRQVTNYYVEFPVELSDELFHIEN